MEMEARAAERGGRGRSFYGLVGSQWGHVRVWGGIVLSSEPNLSFNETV